MFAKPAVDYQPDYPDGVYQFDGYANDQPSWSKIGDPVWSIGAGTWGLCAEATIQGDLLRYTGNPNVWDRIDGPGMDYIVGQDTVYRQSKSWLYLQYVNGTSWTPISQVAQGSFLAYGKWGLVCVSSSDVNNNFGVGIYRYLGIPLEWERIDDGYGFVAVTDDTVYKVTPNLSGVYRYDGSGTSWTQIGGPASNQICAAQ